MCTNSIIQKTSHSPPSETSLERRNPNLNILLGGRRPSRLLSALPPLLLLLLFRLSSPSFPVLPFSKFEGFVPPRYQIWCCFSWNSGEAWRRRECEICLLPLPLLLSVLGLGEMALLVEGVSGSLQVVALRSIAGSPSRCVCVCEMRVVGLVNHGFFPRWRHVQSLLISGASGEGVVCSWRLWIRRALRAVLDNLDH
ncbi:hypothetical protein YC2023_011810 [Brassica napus]